MFRYFASTMTLLATALFASVSHAYDCSNAPQFANGDTYSTGAIVRNDDIAYRCTVGGWCAQGGPYAPDDGWAWAYAWNSLGKCADSSSSSSSSSLSSSSSSSSSSSVPAGNCVDLPAWDSVSAYTGGTRVQYKGGVYQANWWTQGENPTLNSGQWQVWMPEGNCAVY